MFVLELIFVIVWAGALLTTLLNIIFIPRLRPAGWTTRATPDVEGIKAAEPLPEVSVVVPARNEERTIERTVRALLAQTYVPFEVIVVDDRSTDATGRILDLLGADDPRLIVVHGEEPPAGWLGKPWALHEGSRLARGKLLLFLDADIQYSPEAVATLVQRIETRGVSMVSLFPRIEMKGFWEHIAMPQLALMAFTTMPVWLGNLTDIVGVGFGGGPGNLVRRTAFDEMGGYETLKDAVIDDIGMARQLRAHGHSTEVVLGDRLASMRMYHGAREIIDGFTKNLFAAFGASYIAAGFMFAMMLLFHLVPYVLALRGDVLAIVAVSLLTVGRLAVFVRLRYRIDNALFGHPLTTVFWAWIFVRSIWVTGVRRQLHWRGRTYGRNWTRFGTKR